jgi:signal transduction histidine kinase
VSPASLRTRILSGAVWWTVGLSVGGVLLSSAIMLHYRGFPRVLHGTAETHWALSLVFVAVCMFLGFRYVRSGLAPLTELRERLAAVHAGRDRRVDGRYPSEVQPLVDDLNALLAHREATVQRAIAKAGDLAHGLKTPLAVLAHEADRARAAGHGDLADTLAGQVERMRRQIDYHLAQARAAASGATPGARCHVRESADALARTLEHLHAARGLVIQVDVDPGHAVRVQREDLDEMLGNLLDNACKWTRTRVSLSSSAAGATMVLTVDDDGPGVPAAERARVLQRGVRADEAAAGSGLGLAIVRDLAELYGGSISLDDAPGGGLRARLTLPGA